MAWLRIGHVLEQLSRNDEARHAYGNAIHVSPDMAEAHLRFGILSYMAGDIGAAVRSLNEVGKISPNTDMADEARRYLNKIESAPQKKLLPRSTPPISPGDVEMNSGSEPQGYVYVVQLGSFSDRQKAEDLLQQLQEKGYRASVGTREDHELGTVFVVQLEPVKSISRATTLMTQLSGQTGGEPVIIKLRYGR
jgi:tetratricopeptide (TPR) repeat protein